ncbi:MAG: transposase, partial [bacterium]|nr:transposase [bacterium]
MSGGKPERIELEMKELEAILEAAKPALSAEAYEKLKAAIETLGWLTGELEKKNASIAYLRNFLFGTKKSEKASKVLRQKRGEKKKKKKRKGHGRNGSSAYTGADKIKVPHEALKPGAVCSKCEKGKVYLEKDPRTVVRVRGQAPVPATVWEFEVFRCNLCGEEFPAKAPEDVGVKKYDESAVAMIGFLKYGNGMPFHRLERLQANLGIPLPAATQWDYVKKGSEGLDFVYQEVIRQAAQGQVLYNDDTGARILELMKENEEIEEAGTKERTGIFTSGIV